jgi:5-amino-6-(5-phosphoribosylamino)uracil reductase
LNVRPYTILSCAVSLDGYLDDTSDRRLVLSNAADLDRVDAVRADSDAILVGATTIRRDDPRLTIRDPVRRALRAAHGSPEDPVRVTITASGDLDPGQRFFTPGPVPPLVYTPDPERLSGRLDGAATVVAAASLPEALADLRRRGVRRLLVEGGGDILTQFLAGDLADELHLAVAPLFVGDPGAPRWVGSGRLPTGRLRLADSRRIGDVVLLRYLLSQTAVDRYWLAAAIEESRRCPPSDNAFSVGAVIVDASGAEVSRGYSREGDPLVHAEESALSKVDSFPEGSTIYSSLEPCSVRKSRHIPCTELIRAAGIGRVVYAWREPVLFVDGQGVEDLRASGVDVVEVPELAPDVRSVNAHLLR